MEIDILIEFVEKLDKDEFKEYAESLVAKARKTKDPEKVDRLECFLSRFIPQNEKEKVFPLKEYPEGNLTDIEKIDDDFLPSKYKEKVLSSLSGIEKFKIDRTGTMPFCSFRIQKEQKLFATIVAKSIAGELQLPLFKNICLDTVQHLEIFKKVLKEEPAIAVVSKYRTSFRQDLLNIDTEGMVFLLEKNGWCNLIL